MFKAMNAIELLKNPLIGILLVLCYLITIGCNGHLRQRIKKLESDLRTANRNLEIAKSARDKAIQRAKNAESDLRTANRNLEIAKSARDKAIQRAKNAESDLETANRNLEIAKSARDKAIQRAKNAESDLETANRNLETTKSARDKAIQRAETAESDLRTAKSARDKAIQRAKNAESDLRTANRNLEAAKLARNTATQRAKNAEQEKKHLEKLVSLVPQATIKNVRITEKRKDIDILVTFEIKNRKDIEGSVKASFYFANGRALRNKDGPISRSKKFTPKKVTETLTEKLSISYTELNIAQRSDLKFTFRIYDKPTRSYLDREPYSKAFRFDPHKN